MGLDAIRRGEPVTVYDPGPLPWPEGDERLELPGAAGCRYVLENSYQEADEECQTTGTPVRRTFPYSARGRQGYVYTGNQYGLTGGARTPIPIAVKVPVLNEHDVDAFLHESLQAKRVGSNRLGRVFDVLAFDRSRGWPPFGMVMEFYQCTLAQVLRHSAGWPEPVPRKWVADWTLQLLEGLHELHTKDLVHRDFKPTNIMFRLAKGKHFSGKRSDLEGAEIVITDFGTLGTRLGTSGLIVGRDSADDPWCEWKCESFYADIRTDGQFCRASMDIHAFGHCVELLQQLAEGGRQ